jgi:hypothetical protein
MVTETRGTLSAYVPVRGSDTTAAFEQPLQAYLIETVERHARVKLIRQLGIVGALVAAMFVTQWPVAFSSANAVPSLPISASDAGARLWVAAPLHRLAFGTGMQSAF